MSDTLPATAHETGPAPTPAPPSAPQSPTPTTPTPAPREAPAADPGPASALDSLDGDIATLTELRKALDGHQVPPLIARTLTDTGITLTPWIRSRPITALLAVVEALSVGTFIRHRVSPYGAGTDIYAMCKLGGRSVEFVVHTWRYGPDSKERITTSRNGLISRSYLADLAAREAELLGGPDDPDTTRLGLPVATIAADPTGRSGI